MSYANEDRPLVQWSFLQFKQNPRKVSTMPLGLGITLTTNIGTEAQLSAPTPCFLHSSTQIGSRLLLFGGCDTNCDALSQLLLYDANKFQWAAPSDSVQFEQDHPGKRYGHTATLIEMHPPKIMIFGGMVGGGTYEFEGPDMPESIEGDDGNLEKLERTFMNWRKKGKKGRVVEEPDDSVYFLELNSDNWIWSKPLIHGTRAQKPFARAEHSACKTGTNEVTIFGGWTDRPMNDIWVFNFVDMEWKECVTSGIKPRPRYRHTAEIIGRKMYILGGSDSGNDIADGCKHLGIHELCLETMQWTHPQINGFSPFPRSGHSSSLIGARSIAIFGGKRSNEIFLNDLVLIDVETYSVTTINAVEALLPTPVANTSLNVIGNKCIVFGGIDNKGASYNDIRQLDIGYYLNSNDISVGEGASSDYSFKILIIGDASVGKSALLTRFSENTFLPSYTTTIGIDFNSRMIRVDGAICKLEIWDTAGQERFSTITANYYRGAQGALLVYDVSEKDSFENVRKWYDRAIQLGGQDLECVLVGNKNDIPINDRLITFEEGEKRSKEMNIPFVETSALNGTNVENAFVTMTSNIKKSIDRRGLSGVNLKTNPSKTGGVKVNRTDKKKLLQGKCCN